MEVTLIGCAADSWVDDNCCSSKDYPVVLHGDISGCQPAALHAGAGAGPLPFVTWNVSQTGFHGSMFPSLQPEFDACYRLVREDQACTGCHSSSIERGCPMSWVPYEC